MSNNTISTKFSYYVAFPFCQEGRFHPCLLIRDGQEIYTDRENATHFASEAEADALASRLGGSVVLTQAIE